MDELEMFGHYRGAVRDAFRCPELCDRLTNFKTWSDEPGGHLAGGRNQVFHMPPIPGPDGQPIPIAVKRFGSRGRWNDLTDRVQGTRAQRSWLAAVHLDEHSVGTPAPIAFLERWEGRRLVESAYLSLYIEGTTDLRRELIRLLGRDPVCWKMMNLLSCVAQALKALHDSGMVHNDLGNQNIQLRRAADGEWEEVKFIDLNRARIYPVVTDANRGRDLSRLHIPSDLMRILCEMYFGQDPPKAFVRAEARHRTRYQLFSLTRKFRHPILYARLEPQDPETIYPSFRDPWLWDDRSAQPVNVLRRKDRNRLHGKRNALRIGWSTLRALPRVRSSYRRLLAEAYSRPVPMKNRVGIAVEAEPEREEAAFARLQELGALPVLVRLYHHAGPTQWEVAAHWIRRLHEDGYPVAAALVQDRQAVKQPAKWDAFLHDALKEIHPWIEFAEIGHAVNRVKWGAWEIAEVQRLADPVADLRSAYPGIEFLGPAGIDFELPYVAAALDRRPDSLTFDALSHHLYVDRRGAPEFAQGPFDTLRKCALTRAIARCSPCAGDRLVLTEVNWPLLGTGVYSPVNAPYDYPGRRKNDPSVDEETYAAYMIRYLLITIASGLVERVYWWRLAAHGFGLLDDRAAGTWRPRPAYSAFAHFVRTMQDAGFVRYENPAPGIHGYHFDHPAVGPFAMAYTSSGTREVNLPFAYDYSTGAGGENRSPPSDRVTLTDTPRYFFQTVT